MKPSIASISSSLLEEINSFSNLFMFDFCIIVLEQFIDIIDALSGDDDDEDDIH